MATESGGHHLEAAVIDVEGMTCNSCVHSIEDQLGSLHGVLLIKVHVCTCMYVNWKTSLITTMCKIYDVHDVVCHECLY